MNSPHKLGLAITAALLLPLAVATAQSPAGDGDAARIVAELESQGYTEVRDMDVDDGFWEVEARGSDGRFVELTVDAASGEILDPQRQPQLEIAEVVQLLEGQGYTGVSVERDDGLFEAEATNAEGQAVELRIDPRDGRVVRERLDD